MTTPEEREIKFDFAQDGVLPRWQELGGAVEVHDRGVIAIDATYWDTAALLLAANHIGVRRRLGSGWTYKGPSRREGDALVREELEWPDSESIPEALAERVRQEVGDVVLQPVAHIFTWRHRIDIVDPDGDRVLEIADDSVSVLDDDTEVERFREVEVEVVGAASEDLIAEVVATLTAAGASVHTLGKYTRALRALGKTPSA